MTSRAVLAFVLLALALPICVPAHAADPAEVLGTSGKPITIEARQGRLIRLSQDASTVFIADSDIADVQVKTPRLIYIFGKAAGDTTLYAVDGKDRVLLNRRVHVTHDLAELRRSVAKLVPNESIGLRSVDGSLVVSGTVSSAAAAEDVRRLATSFAGSRDAVINQMQVRAPHQVNLRVRVAEMSRQTVKRLGINWDAVARSGNFLFGLATGVPTTTRGVPFFPLPGLAPPAGNSFATRNNGANTFFGNFNNGTGDVNAMVDALEDEGLITVLAEPNLSALSGETASFLAGGEFPIPVPQDNNSITVTFKKFGVGLAFTPTIISRNRINIKVAPEVSQLSNAGAVTLQGFTVPALTVRRAETTVELASGQSFAIAGLIQNNTNYDVRKFPWLSDVPILGRLFTSESFQRDETELIILVTPYVVHPVEPQQTVAASGAVRGAGQGAPALEKRLPNDAAGAGDHRLYGPAGFSLE